MKLSTTQQVVSEPLSCAALKGIDWPLFIISGGFLLAFLVAALVDIDSVSGLVNTLFAWSTKFFGLYWQVLMLLTFLVSLGICCTKCGRVRLGGVDQKPDTSTFNWIAVIMCALLAGGGAFWAAAEPLMHFASPPPLFAGVQPHTEAAGYAALAQSYVHWGFLAWAVLGSLLAIVLMHLHYDKGLPLAPRTLLYPLLGQRALKGPIGTLADATSIIAVVAGTIGPIGFLGLQISNALHAVLGIPNDITTQAITIILVTVMYTTSCLVGLKGIRFVSEINVWLMIGLAVFMVALGPTAFILGGFPKAFGLHLEHFIPMTLFRADPKWLDWWTVFYWGWFIGYAPMVALYVAKISRGRTIREIILTLSIIAPIVTMFWFTVVGGTGIGLELQTPGIVTANGAGPEALLLGVTQSLPLGGVISALFLFLSFISVATNGDAMAFTVAMAMSGNDKPKKWLRAFWAIGMGLAAVVLITIGAGGVTALQSFIVITAVPVSLLILPSLWDALRIARRMAVEQQI
ncbi:BCCT family transporter [Pseudomonas cavernicola]|uniref:BCCT family transporter n=1 Tax=Pseudomonas cavernicola TaxID=2320866 RepID=A0A418X940_9PSED|nr:BCCT family transporter [Pseudomonas cavernicola]RJG09002.1 BCCT family transporter [Pseudomonas cavernicola]